jgi:hypothetical protein
MFLVEVLQEKGKPVIFKDHKNVGHNYSLLLKIIYKKFENVRNIVALLPPNFLSHALKIYRCF